uniref:Protein kinase domain-containing protein n=1 Tax=Arcella intermedia TaxID=1963864 RepID=A0A6B2LTA8_9EUKA
MSKSEFEEFEREIGLMAKCNSEFIVRLMGTCYESGKYYIVMEFMKNGNLQSYLEIHKTHKNDSPLKIRYQMACDISRGIYYLHHVGIVHADVKSSNVLLGETF